MMSECPQVSSWSSRRRNSTKCPVPKGPASTGSSSTPWLTTPPLWAPGSTSSVRPQRAFWMEASTTAPRRGAKRRQRPRRLMWLPATEHECDPDAGSLFWFGENSAVLMFVRTYCRRVCIWWNKCTHSSVPHVEMFIEPFLSGGCVSTLCSSCSPACLYVRATVLQSDGKACVCGTDILSKHTH